MNRIIIIFKSYDLNKHISRGGGYCHYFHLTDRKITLHGRYHPTGKDTEGQNEVTSPGQLMSEKGMAQNQICLAFKIIIFSMSLNDFPSLGVFLFELNSNMNSLRFKL